MTTPDNNHEWPRRFPVRNAPATEELKSVDQRRLVRPEFVAQMEAELQANAHKGDWQMWKPTALQVLSELQHHEAKLIHALAIGDCEHVREFAADIANIAMKIDEQFGGPNVCAHPAAPLDAD